jgi:antirestriction protein ArdC
MTTDTQPSAQLTAKIEAYVEELAALTDQARIADAMRAYLETASRFHHYSPGNVMLILLARPNAQQVAGYRTWQQVGRQVRKGERGIAILAPMFIRLEKDNPDSKTLVRFKVVYVFDLAQTEGEPLPEPPNWTSPERNELLTQRLLAFAASLGITVTIERLAGTAQGASAGGSIVLSPEAGTKTLIHELAHELLHQGKEDRSTTREAKEAEAEAVAYVVGRHFGLESLGSPNYLALWHADSKVLKAHLERIVGCSRQIITALEDQTQPVKEMAA